MRESEGMRSFLQIHDAVVTRFRVRTSGCRRPSAVGVFQRYAFGDVVRLVQEYFVGAGDHEL